MKKAITTTTINSPTKALSKFQEIASRDGWGLFIAGDKKTPHDEYQFFGGYLSPKVQEDRWSKLSKLIPWNSIQRRNFAILAALEWGAEIIATVDDDNIPLENWGQSIFVGEQKVVDIHSTNQTVFDPLYFDANIWHRGFPIQLLEKKGETKFTMENRTILVQANLWNGDPDVDAICRIAKRPNLVLDVDKYYSSNKIGPFNSQNTILSSKVFPTYFLFPYIGRMDDIWASYLVQKEFPKSVIWGPATVKQERNKHNLVEDLKNEMIGYENTLNFISSGMDLSYLPEKAQIAYEAWKELFK